MIIKVPVRANVVGPFFFPESLGDANNVLISEDESFSFVWKDYTYYHQIKLKTLVILAVVFLLRTLLSS
jgi:hypothetical protein